MDSLAVGPLPVASSLQQWAAVRKRFWQGVYEQAAFPGGDAEVLPDLGLLTKAEQIVLWIGNGLDEQLLLPWLCWVLREVDIERERVHVVELRGPLPNRATPTAAGMFSAEDLRKQPAPVQLSSEQISLLDRAWTAVTSPSPHGLVEFFRNAHGNSPLARALMQLARRYPQRDSGLSAWDHALLSNTLSKGPGAARIVGHTLVGPGTELDCIGDVWLFWRLKQLARARCPLLALGGDDSQYARFHVTLTNTGRRVLECRENAVTLNGIDEWVAGVHLDSSANRVWFADGDRIAC